jgi:hypothetical protein
MQKRGDLDSKVAKSQLAGVPNDVPLVPHLRALAKQNVIVVKNKARSR